MRLSCRMVERSHTQRRSSWVALALLLLTIAPISALAGEATPSAWKGLSLSRSTSGQDRMALGDLKGRTRILMAWRADCLPCLLELKHVASLEQAASASGVELIALALDEPTVVTAKLKSLGIRPLRTWYALDEDDAVIAALSGNWPSLPVSVAIDRRGELCGRRTGILGTDLIARWAAQCL